MLALLLPVNASVAQTLAVDGDHFNVDGVARFLVFVSYFHGLDRPEATLSADLRLVHFEGRQRHTGLAQRVTAASHEG